MTADERYDDAELSEARALAEAIERGHAGDPRVAGAFDAAEFVAVLKAPELDAQRSDAILAETERRIRANQRRARNLRILFGSSAATIAAATAAAALLTLREPSRYADMRAEVPTAAEPQASQASEPTGDISARSGGSEIVPLRAAQLAWLSSPSAASAAQLERALAALRSEQLSALERRYSP